MRRKHGISIADTDLPRMLDRKMDGEGLTYAAVSEATGLSESTVFAIRCGQRSQVLAAVLDALAPFLGVRDRSALLDRARDLRTARLADSESHRSALLEDVRALEQQLAAAANDARVQGARAERAEDALHRAMVALEHLAATMSDLRGQIQELREIVPSDRVGTGAGAGRPRELAVPS